MAAVAQFIFNPLSQFCKGLRVPVGDKQRIITEPGMARRRQNNSTLAFAFKEFGPQFKLVGIANRRSVLGMGRFNFCQGEHAPKSGRALSLGKIFEQVQQLRVVGGIGGIARRPGVQICKPRRMHSGRAMEGIDFQPRVIRQHKVRRLPFNRPLQSGHPPRQFHRFLRGVARESARVFNHLRSSGKFIERQNPEIPGQNGADLAGFVAISGGQKKRRHERILAGSRCKDDGEILKMIGAAPRLRDVVGNRVHRPARFQGPTLEKSACSARTANRSTR